MNNENNQSKSDPKVITVTVNPSLDRTVTTHFLAVGYHNRTTETTKLDPAGRGVNISRALHALGVATHAIILLGHDSNGQAYQWLLAEEEFPITILRREGRTRSNILIRDTGHNHETVILEDSEGATYSDLREMADMLIQHIAPGDRVVFSGSLPNGVRNDTYAWFTSVAQTAGASVCVNAGGGEALQQSLQARPGLIYLTQSQLEGLFNFPVRAAEDVIHCAQQLRAQRAGKVLVAMNDADSAVLATEKGNWVVDLWDEVIGTRTGQAEALIAGYLVGRLNNWAMDEALELGAAAAAYAVSHVGNRFGTLRDVQQYMHQVGAIEIDRLDRKLAELIEKSSVSVQEFDEETEEQP
jgi:1-phosphofructokinase